MRSSTFLRTSSKEVAKIRRRRISGGLASAGPFPYRVSPEINFSDGARGKYARRYAQGERCRARSRRGADIGKPSLARTLREDRLSCIVFAIGEKRTSKAALKNFTAEIARKRRKVSRLKEALGDMLDHLSVIEARARAAGGKRYSTVEVKKAPGL